MRTLYLKTQTHESFIVGWISVEHRKRQIGLEVQFLLGPLFQFPNDLGQAAHHKLLTLSNSMPRTFSTRLCLAKLRWQQWMHAPKGVEMVYECNKCQGFKGERHSFFHSYFKCLIIKYTVYIEHSFSMSAAGFCVYLFNYDSLIITLLSGAKNRAILPSFPAVTSTSGDIATPPVHFL